MAENDTFSQDNESNCSNDLSLSCESLSFDEDESVGNIPLGFNQGIENSINPYQFEPYDSDMSDEHNSEQDDNDSEESNRDRLENTSWCTCANCNPMPTATESLCCKEIQRVQDLAENIPNLDCIVNHPGFHNVCLDQYVLDVAYFQYKQQYGDRPEQANERKRYTAYRQFVRWCWQFLGKDVRVVLPSCVVTKIRNTFPAPAQNYTGFLEPTS